MKLSRISSIASRRTFTVFFLLSLFTVHFPLFTNPVRAYDPPNPQPCQNSQETFYLTSNYIIDESGEPPQGLRFEVTESGQLGDTFSKTFEATYQVDFSKLQSIFGPANSNYLEGKVQSEQQRTSNIFTLNKSDFNKFHGPQQKATPKIITDEQKVKYVKYILENPTLPEASNQYTNTKGQNKKTIYNLIQDGFPSSPKPPSMGGNQEEWLTNWGKYWEKIPTAYREFYNGYLNFSIAESDTYMRWAQGELTQSDRDKLAHISGASIGDVSCLPLARDPIRFVMPEFSRTVTISDSLNQVVVPCAAQSWRHAPESQDKLDECKAKPSAQAENDTNSDSLLAKALNICKKIITSPQNAVQKIKNAVKVSFRLLNPLKDTYAETPPCLVKLPEGAKEGSAPFCALPNDQLKNGDRCIDKPSENKLDKENKNVICEFKVSYTIEFKIDPNSPQWNLCAPEGGGFRCSTVVRIFPDFRIPFITEIWNNTTYSENQGGTNTNQKTGRPGIYSTFIPKALFEEDINRETLAELQKGCPGGVDIASDPECARLADLLDELRNKYPDIEAQTGECNITTSTQLDQCIGRYFGRILSKSQPGKAKTETGEQKQRFIGAADCNKFVARDLSLKPKALQKYQGITGIAEECLLQTSTVAVTGPVDFDEPPTPTDTADCGSSSSFSQLLPNSVPQSAGAVSPSQLSLLDSGDVVRAAKNAAQITGTPCELLVGLHYVEAGWGNGSFISGRPIGEVEPDVNLPSDCTSAGGTFVEPPISADTGCIFTSLGETAIYAGFLIQVKVSYLIGEQRPPANFEEMIGAMSYYNGGGNHNCGWGTAYAGPCPPPTGIDDPYALSHFDNQHATMFLIYCGDLQLCNPPESFNRDGAATAAKEFYLKNKK